VDWDDAKRHVLSHVIHYGSSLFEGLRCYPTVNGPAIFFLIYDSWMVRNGVVRLSSFAIPGPRFPSLETRISSLGLSEGVAEDSEASGRPRRMSKDGIGGPAADSEPVLLRDKPGAGSAACWPGRWVATQGSNRLGGRGGSFPLPKKKKDSRVLGV